MAKGKTESEISLLKRFVAFQAMTTMVLLGIQVALIVLEAGEAALKRLAKLNLGGDSSPDDAE